MENPVINHPTGYDLDTAQFLSGMVGLAYEQLEHADGPDPWPNGQIPADLIPGFTQVAAFQVPELALTTAVTRFLELHPELLPLVTTPVIDLPAARAAALNARLSAALQDRATLDRIALGVKRRWFGYALVPTAENPSPANVVAIRGTRTPYEWAMDLVAVQVPVPLAWYSDGRFRLARVHLGFLILYAFLSRQVLDAAARFNPGVPTLATGHSLGSALATFASLQVKLRHLEWDVKMYNLATPRVGDPVFVTAYNYFIPDAFRITNLCDLVTMVPPTTLTIPPDEDRYTARLQYGDVGKEWSYLWQTGNVADNHSWRNNYDESLRGGVPTGQSRTYPNSGIPCPPPEPEDDRG